MKLLIKESILQPKDLTEILGNVAKDININSQAIEKLLLTIYSLVETIADSDNVSEHADNAITDFNNALKLLESANNYYIDPTNIAESKNDLKRLQHYSSKL